MRRPSLMSRHSRTGTSTPLKHTRRWLSLSLKQRKELNVESLLTKTLDHDISGKIGYIIGHRWRRWLAGRWAIESPTRAIARGRQIRERAFSPPVTCELFIIEASAAASTKAGSLLSYMKLSESVLQAGSRNSRGSATLIRTVRPARGLCESAGLLVEYEATHCSGLSQGVLQSVQLCEFNIAETFRFVITIFDDLDRLELYTKH